MSFILFVVCCKGMFALTRTTMIVAAMTASVFATPAAFGQLIDLSLIEQTAGIDDSDTNVQVNSAEVNQNAENDAKIDAGKKSTVKANVLAAASVQTATVTQSNTNSDDDVNVIDQGLVDILVDLGAPELPEVPTA